MTDGPAPRFGGVATVRVGADAAQARPPRTGSDVTSGFAALEQLRADHHGWSKDNPRDWNELLALFAASGIDFLVVGAYALAAHGHERYTKDLDLWLAPTARNASKLKDVLDTFGFPGMAPSEDEWTTQRTMIQLGREPYRVEVLNFASGLDFDSAWKHSVTGRLGENLVHCLDRDALVTNKLASGRIQDFADAEAIAPERSDEIRAALAAMLASPRIPSA